MVEVLIVYFPMKILSFHGQQD